MFWFEQTYHHKCVTIDGSRTYMVFEDRTKRKIMDRKRKSIIQ